MGRVSGAPMNLDASEPCPLQAAKAVVRSCHAAVDKAKSSEELIDALQSHVQEPYLWRGVHPFNEQSEPAQIVDVFWKPLRQAFGKLQRRDDIFMAGSNVVDGGDSVWVCSMGHFLGMFDREWLGIRPTGVLTYHRYCEFNCVKDGKIIESCMHVDILSVMHQAGQYPLPASTGSLLMTPGPRTHNGLLFGPQDESEGAKTLELTQDMMNRLLKLNIESVKTGKNICPPEVLAEHWTEDMLWYGPTGIGATGLSIPRYQQQHQMPFRTQLGDKVFHGHVSRFAEGDYCAWFGWPNLTNKALGGFLGLPAGSEDAEMRVVDIYRREGDKLAENWVLIDMLHYLKCRGIDVLKRNVELTPSPQGEVFA